MTRTRDYSGLPEHMRPGMQRYLEHGIIPGSFLLAVLENDLMGAAGKADAVNLARLADYARFLYSEAPRGSYGSSEDVREWSKARQTGSSQCEQSA